MSKTQHINVISYKPAGWKHRTYILKYTGVDHYCHLLIVDYSLKLSYIPKARRSCRPDQETYTTIHQFASSVPL